MLLASVAHLFASLAHTFAYIAYLFAMDAHLFATAADLLPMITNLLQPLPPQEPWEIYFTAWDNLTCCFWVSVRFHS